MELVNQNLSTLALITPTELIRIKHVTNYDIRYKQLPFGTVSSIGKLKIK